MGRFYHGGYWIAYLQVACAENPFIEDKLNKYPFVQDLLKMIKQSNDLLTTLKQLYYFKTENLYS